MPSLKIAGVDVENVQVGSTQVQAVYVGSTKLWERSYSAVMTVGYNTHSYTGSSVRNFEAGYSSFSQLPGFSGCGSMSKTSIDLGNGSETLVTLRSTGRTTDTFTTLTLSIWNGDDPSINGGWTTLKIGGYTFSRSSGTFTYAGGFVHYRNWTWTTQNPFGTTAGVTKNISIE
jgi:hypothetical protein